MEIILFSILYSRDLNEMDISVWSILEQKLSSKT